jgi:hypothetical protein
MQPYQESGQPWTLPGQRKSCGGSGRVHGRVAQTELLKFVCLAGSFICNRIKKGEDQRKKKCHTKTIRGKKTDTTSK